MDNNQIASKHVITLKGEYRLVARKENGEERELAKFPNVITDIGLNKLGNAGVVTACRVGTGNSTPSVLNTTLDAQIAYSQSYTKNTVNLSTSPYTSITTWKFSFGQGVAAGNLSEIGVGWATSGTTLFSRALILDGLGNPTTITILSDEYLDAYYTLQQNPPLTDVTGTIVLEGVTYSWTCRASQVTSPTSWEAGRIGTYSASSPAVYSGDIGAVTSYPTGTSASINKSTPTYADGTYTLTFNVSAGPTIGNIAGGFKSIHIPQEGMGTWQVGFNDFVPKTNVKTLSLTFQFSYARA